MGWLDWLSGSLSGASSAIAQGLSYVEHLIFPNKNTHIKSGHVVGYQPHIPEVSPVYTKYTEVPKHKVNIPNLGLTPTARKSLEEVGTIPSYIPKPEVSSSPTAEKPGVYTPYGYFKNSTDYTKYLIWKKPDVYFPDVFKSDKELYNLYYIKHDYEGARELFRRKYANLIRHAVSNPEIIRGIEWGSITHLKVVNGKLVPVNVESEIPPSMRKHWEETHPTILKHIPTHSVPKPAVTLPKFGLGSQFWNAVEHKRANTHITQPTPTVTPKKVTTETKNVTTKTKTTTVETTPVSALSGIIGTVIPVMSAVLMIYVVRKIIHEVRV